MTSPNSPFATVADIQFAARLTQWQAREIAALEAVAVEAEALFKPGGTASALRDALTVLAEVRAERPEQEKP